LILISSCDPSNTADYYINNKTSTSLELKMYRFGEVNNDKFVDQNSTTLILRSQGLSIGPFNLDYFDSIHLVSNQIIITYYPSQVIDKSMYDLDNWEIEILEDRKRNKGLHVKYVYIFDPVD